MRVFKISMLGVVLLALAVGTSEQAGLAQAGCSIMVKPGESIQRAIDAAKEGAVICLTAGMWEENVEIKKSLTLRGAGREQTKIKGKKEDEPVIMIASDAEIEVTIEGLAAAEAKGYREGIEVAGKARVTITNSQISGNEGDGIHMVDSAQATISNSQISGNESAGIFIDYSTRVTITNSQISGNKGMGINMGISAQATISNSQISSNGKLGIWMWSSTQATITNSQISGNEWDGIGMVGSAQATISNSQISGNGYNGIEMWESAQATISNSQISGNKGGGIGVGGSAQATITNSQISGNGYTGIWMWGSAQAEIRGSTIEGNGTSEDCKKNNYICNGIWLYAKSQVKIIDSTIRNNADWGVGAYLKQCGEYTDDFTGTVTFEDMMLDQIAGNNTSGNQNGMGNPGNHYWNRPDIPDGQVCLP